MHTTAVYQGQRAQTSTKRVFILTRSAFAGQQRNAALTWSGDISGTWAVLATQIPAGLNFSLAGIPYWNTDIGGFFGGDPADPAYAELFTRWFEFGAFCPMFRVHGTGAPKEVWRFPEGTQAVLRRYDELRYRLLPYLYSVAWRVTHDRYTMLRPLVMDYRADRRVYDVKDQFLVGPALMACPVVEAGATHRQVYLPSGTRWTDFWTGETRDGGASGDAPAPIETIPLYVPAGTILPLGPPLQYASEKLADPLELRIYRGADGRFDLYEDQGDGYAYEHGAYAIVPMRWDERSRTLTIEARRGAFPGMLGERRFRVVCVGPGHGDGVAPSPRADAEVVYRGEAVSVRLK
jgi:alpha-D-xyloside xylohydrolase